MSENNNALRAAALAALAPIEDADILDDGSTLDATIPAGRLGVVRIVLKDGRAQATAGLAITNALVGHGLEVVWEGSAADPTAVATLVQDALREAEERDEEDHDARSVVLPRNGGWSSYPEVVRGLEHALSGNFPETLAAVLNAAGVVPIGGEACVGALWRAGLRGTVVFKDGRWSVHLSAPNT